MATDHDLQGLAERLGLPFQEQIDDALADETLLSRLPLAFARSRCLLPLAIQNGQLLVAVGNPADLLAQDEVAKLYGLPVSGIVVPQEELLAAINRLYSRTAGSARDVVENLIAEDLSTIATELSRPHDLLDLTDEAPVIRLLHAILFQAVKERASDIHIEPYERSLEVRFRIDGILHLKLEPPKVVQEALVSRVKIMASLNIAEKRLPQDGRLKVLVAGHEVDVRVSIVPTFFGERTVLRLLDRKQGVRSLGAIGFSERDTTIMERLLSRSNGIILVTGPTGSGKTTTLYSSLRTLSSPEINIITIEDPIEMVMEQFNQIGVQQAIGVTFGNILRTVLRQDPDIVMVGEIRDQDTADNAVQAALTGHLVLSTLHTNDAPSSIARLLDLEVPPYLISATVMGIVAQRLLRKVCSDCKTVRELSKEEREYLQIHRSKVRVVQGAGCKECRGTGYKGRTGIFEVLEITDRIKQLISVKADPTDIVRAAEEDGFASLRQLAIRKMLEGLTTYDEVVSITG